MPMKGVMMRGTDETSGSLFNYVDLEGDLGCRVLGPPDGPV